MIALVDYDMGNLHSVQKAVAKVGYESFRVNDPENLEQADLLILPGVGAFRDAITALQSRGLDQAIRSHIQKGKPFLGICLGLQLLFDRSEESGGVDGLGILPGVVKKFSKSPGLKIPHMGWNQVHCQENAPEFAKRMDARYFYFVHSYYVEPRETDIIAGVSSYPKAFCVAVSKDNIFAVQFHLEKSQKNGLELLGFYLKSHLSQKSSSK